jgi:hypothetical protein
MRKTLGLAIALTVLRAVHARADNMKLTCTGTTTCSAAGGVFATQQSASGNPTFNLTNTGTTGLTTGSHRHPVDASGTAYLAILVPGNSALSFTVDGLTPDSPVSYTSGKLLSVLGESGGNPMNFEPYASTAGAAAGSTVSGFEAYDVALGTFDTSGAIIPVWFDVKGGTLPNGTILVGFLEDNNQNGLVVDQTSNSESLVVDGPRPSPTPEPASLFLFGSGLLTVGGTLLRRLKLQGRS